MTHAIKAILKLIVFSSKYMQYKIIFRKQRKLLKFSSALTAPVCGAVVGQENRLDVTNPHTERV